MHKSANLSYIQGRTGRSGNPELSRTVVDLENVGDPMVLEKE